MNGVWVLRTLLTIDSEPYDRECATFAEARSAGRHFACVSGAVSVEVLSPAGRRACWWSRSDSVWHEDVGAAAG